MMHNHNFEPTREQRKKRVNMDGRAFFVAFKPDGSPRSIMERKLRADGRFRSETYWHHSHRVPLVGRKGRRRSIVIDVLKLAGVDTRQFTNH